jgi:mRNA interferase HicA
VKGSEFIRAVEKLGKKQNKRVAFIATRGKGSHGILYFGEELTTVRNPKDELKTGTLHGMLKQLGLKLNDIQ